MCISQRGSHLFLTLEQLILGGLLNKANLLQLLSFFLLLEKS